MDQKRCLVTGGAGFIASHLVEALVKAGHLVTVLDDLSTGHIENLKEVWNKITFIQGDVRDPNTVFQACQNQDVVFHYAALASVFRSFQEPETNFSTNVTGTFNMLNACQTHQVGKIIFVSSSSVYADTENPLQDESHPTQPVSPYAHSKWIGEQLCHMYSTCYGLNITIFRYFNVYGTRQEAKSPYSGVITIFNDNIQNNKPCTIFGDGLQSRDFVHVSDVVQANLLAMDSEKSGIYNIGNGYQCNLIELVDQLAEAKEKHVSVQHEAGRPGEARHTLANISKATQELGYVPKMSFSEGLKEIHQETSQRSKRFEMVWHASQKAEESLPKTN